jgi:hypothetical protein
MAQRPHRWPSPVAETICRAHCLRPPAHHAPCRACGIWVSGWGCLSLRSWSLSCPLCRGPFSVASLQYTHAAVPAYSDPSDSRRSAPGLAEYVQVSRALRHRVPAICL